jgi:hypothetical protein
MPVSFNFSNSDFVLMIGGQVLLIILGLIVLFFQPITTFYNQEGIRAAVNKMVGYTGESNNNT